jgi:hypothetical protein
VVEGIPIQAVVGVPILLGCRKERADPARTDKSVNPRRRFTLDARVIVA